MMVERVDKTKNGFSLVEVMVACLVLGIALVSLVGSIMWDVVNVKLQDGKNRAMHLANIILEEMATRPLNEIVDTDWNQWLSSSPYADILPQVEVVVSFPLVYEAERKGNAYAWGYTYRWGNMYPGLNPRWAKALLEVELELRWQFRGHPVNYKVSTIFSEIRKRS